MRSLGLAMFACGLLLAQQAGASSFAVVGAPPSGPSRSIIMLGEPAEEAPQVVLAPTDDMIQTAAFSTTDETSRAAVAPITDFDERDNAAWPPPLSTSMVAYGEPPARPRKEGMTGYGGQAGLPMVIRGGLVGEAYPTASAPPASPVLPAPEPRKERMERRAEPKPEAPAVAEQRGSLPHDEPPGRNKSPEPAAPPPAPAPPPPPTQRLE